MREVLEDGQRWLTAGSDVALATVIQTWGSAPRRVGAKMAVAVNPATAVTEMAGSVSGGCVEGAVVEAAQEVLANGRPQLLHFGVADETAWDIGLACGGTIELFVQRLNPDIFAFVQTFIREEQSGAVVTVIRGPEEKLGRTVAFRRNGGQVGTLGRELDVVAQAQAVALTAPHRLVLTDELEIFVDVFRPSPTLVMVGGVHIAVALTTLAKTLGYQTIVIDPRRAFGNETRFPHADKLIQAWPEEAFAQVALTPETAVALLTHDPKIDDPALKLVLPSPVFYIGALGSNKTAVKRHERLQAMGFSEAQIGRIHGPIGLDLGAVTPEEIALSILAQIVASQHHPK